MPLTVYEKHNVQDQASVVVTGQVNFNVLNQPRTPKSTKQVPNPKPEFVISLDHVSMAGDPNLKDALAETMYGDHNENISLRSKSPYAPTIFGKNREKTTGDKLIPEGKALKNGQEVLVHVVTFATPQNLGCGFDAVMLKTNLEDVELQDANGSVSADVFGAGFDNPTEPQQDWSTKK